MMLALRTTITLDPDTEALVKKRMHERGISFKQAVNEAIRAGLAGESRNDPEFRTETVAMGRPRVGLVHAMRIAAELEDQELARKAEAGK
jgi:hypothetical protein